MHRPNILCRISFLVCSQTLPNLSLHLCLRTNVTRPCTASPSIPNSSACCFPHFNAREKVKVSLSNKTGHGLTCPELQFQLFQGFQQCPQVTLLHLWVFCLDIGRGRLGNHKVLLLPQSSLLLGSRLSELIWTWVVKFNDSSHDLILPTLIILQSIS